MSDTGSYDHQKNGNFTLDLPEGGKKREDEDREVSSSKLGLEWEGINKVESQIGDGKKEIKASFAYVELRPSALRLGLVSERVRRFGRSGWSRGHVGKSEAVFEDLYKKASRRHRLETYQPLEDLPVSWDNGRDPFESGCELVAEGDVVYWRSTSVLRKGLDVERSIRMEEWDTEKRMESKKEVS